MADATFYQVLQGNTMLTSWLSHIPQLILQIINLVLCLNALLQFGDDLAEEHVNDESVDSALVEDIENAPEVVQRLWRLFVLHGKHEVEERLVVHLALECLQLLEDAIDENCRQTRGIPRQLSLVKHTIFIYI